MFQDKRDSTIDSFPNLDVFFKKLSDEYKDIIKKDDKKLNDKQKASLKKISKNISDNILREVMVRRTRNDLITNKMYAKDLKSQNLTFPKTNPIVEIEYKMDSNLSKNFKKTIEIMTKNLSYARYKILANLSKRARKIYYNKNNITDVFVEMSSDNLASIIKNQSIKMLESSFEAFKSTISNQMKNLTFLIKMFDEDKIIINTDGKFNSEDVDDNDKDI